MLCYESILVGILVSFLLLFWLLEGAMSVVLGFIVI